MRKRKGSDDIISRFEAVSATEGGILTRLFRDILLDTNRINTLVSDIRTAVRERRISRSSYDTAKLISAPHMSFKTFVWLLYNILNAKSVVFSVTIEHKNGVKSTHEVDVVQSGKNAKKEKE